MRKDLNKKAHATYSASGAYRWLACPASVNLEKGLESKERAAAQNGTKAHDLLELILNGTVVAPWDKPYYGPEMWDKCKAAARKVKLELLHLKKSEGESTLEIEKKIFLPVSVPNQFGTADVVIRGKETLHVIDFKYGVYKVKPKENSQLIFYALGVAHEYKYKYKKVLLSIIQPFCADRYGNTMSTWKTGIKTLKEWRVIFENGVKASKAKNPKLVTGSHCFFCRAKEAGICPAQNEKRLERTKSYF